MWRLGHRPALDGLRGIAVLLVVASHVRLPPFTDAAGHVGVTMFFTLSGFLIATLLFEELEQSGRISLTRFYRRRALRLLPALVSMTLACILVSLVSGIAFVTRSEVIGTLFYCSNVIAMFAPPEPGGMLHHTWSLVLEEQFYLVWPAVMLALWRRPRTLLCVLAAGAVFSAVQRFVLIGEAGHERLVYGTDTRIDGILIGCALAVGLRHRVVELGVRRLAFIGVSYCIFLAAAPVGLTFLFGITVVAVATAASITGIVAGRAPSLLRWRWLTFVGRRSYGLYLWHHPVLILVNAIAPGSHWLVTTLAVVPLSALLTGLSWTYVEQPFLRLKNPRGRQDAEPIPALTQLRTPTDAHQ